MSEIEEKEGKGERDEKEAIGVKVEKQKQTREIEREGGEERGIGGGIREIIGRGLAARPIAATDVFCVATFDNEVPT